MDILKHLADSERQVSEDETRVERQRLRVRELHDAKASKVDIDKAFDEMLRLEERLSLHTGDRDWYAAALEASAEE